jgi:hypothetical protein
VTAVAVTKTDNIHQSHLVGLVATYKHNRYKICPKDWLQDCLKSSRVIAVAKTHDQRAKSHCWIGCNKQANSVSWIGYKICKIAVTGLSEELTGDCCY